MFTGIVKGVGHVARRQSRGGDLRLELETDGLNPGVRGVAVGDSLLVNGVCLTALEAVAGRFVADVSRETLTATTLNGLAVGTRVNLEPALAAGEPLGGHLVSGHVDGIAQLLSRRQEARSVRMVFRLPQELARFVARKGSVCVDGVSLTVNGVRGAQFDVNVIPHTLTATTLGELAAGERVNIEVDLIARYVERLLAETETPPAKAGRALREMGYG